MWPCSCWILNTQWHKVVTVKKPDRKSARTYTVPLLHAHGNLNKLVNVSDDGTQPTVAVCNAGRHTLAAVPVQWCLFVEVITFIQHGVWYARVQPQRWTTEHIHIHRRLFTALANLLSLLLGELGSEPWWQHHKYSQWYCYYYYYYYTQPSTNTYVLLATFYLNLI